MIVCVVCGNPREGFKRFVEGWCCRSCWLRADVAVEIRVIDGQAYMEPLKGSAAPSLTLVENETAPIALSDRRR